MYIRNAKINICQFIIFIKMRTLVPQVLSVLQYQVCEKTSFIFQDKREIELEQEAKLKAKYGGLKKPGGGSTLLQKRLQKGVSNGICYRIISLDL